MSAAALRIRKRIQIMSDAEPGTYPMDYREALSDILYIIDEELEREAERQFTRPITPASPLK